jgi:TPR repeat protein
MINIFITFTIMCVLSCQDHRGYQLNNNELSQLEKIGEEGDIEVCWCLYLYYEEDEDSSMYWLKKGAINGDPNAQYLWASLTLHKKMPDKKLIEEGLIILKKAAEKDEPTAQEELGYYYYQGKFVERDLKQSEYWYRRSAMNGYSNSFYPLSKVLTEKNNFDGLIEAYTWLLIDIDLSGLKPGKYGYEENKKQQLVIIEKVKKQGFNESSIKKTAEEQAIKKKSEIKKYRWRYDPRFYNPLMIHRCMEKIKSKK